MDRILMRLTPALRAELAALGAQPALEAVEAVHAAYLEQMIEAPGRHPTNDNLRLLLESFMTEVRAFILLLTAWKVMVPHRREEAKSGAVGGAAVCEGGWAFEAEALSLISSFISS